MSAEYPPGIFAQLMGRSPPLVRLIASGCLLLACLALRANAHSGATLIGAAGDNSAADAAVELIETITFRDAADGLEHEEYAFREPARGLPEHVLDMFCSSVRLRLYWNSYRDEIKESHRKGLYLRRMARLAKHVFEEVRDIDKPFNATQLSVVDEYLSAGDIESAEDKKLDKAIEGQAASGANGGEAVHETGEGADGEPSLGRHSSVKGLNFKGIKEKLSKKRQSSQSAKQETGNGAQQQTTGERVDGDSVASGAAQQQSPASDETGTGEVYSDDLMEELERQGHRGAMQRLRAFTKRWTLKRFAIALYTRWRTMWWMMMSCLFTKYYLWDPALDEFTKLKRSLLMWPELQLVKMHDLRCKPLVFFRRVMDICKILNPLMRVDFGQFNLEKLTRFKSDQK